MKPRIIFVLGVASLFIGLASNEWLMAKLLSSDGVLEPITRIRLWSLNLFFILTGLLFIWLRHKIYSFIEGPFSSFSRKHPSILFTLYMILFTVVFLLSVEAVTGALYFLKIKRDRLTTETAPPVEQKDELLGYRLKPNVTASQVKRRNGQLIYQATYSTDQFGRRNVPLHSLEGRDRFILFFGCSFTFGVGVNDDETLPFYVAQRTPHYYPYNYGVAGYGPQQMLALFESEKISNQVVAKKGIAVYTFATGHVQRAIGSLDISTTWGANFPYYTLEGNRLVRKGSFRSGRPLLYQWYRSLSKRYFFLYFGINPPRLHEGHFRLTAKILEESRNRFRDQFGIDDFYVLFYPGAKCIRFLKPYLDKAGVRYLDYSNLFDMDNERFSIPGDGHPTPLAHSTIAKQLVKDLEIGAEPEKIA